MDFSQNERKTKIWWTGKKCAYFSQENGFEYAIFDTIRLKSTTKWLRRLHSSVRIQTYSLYVWCSRFEGGWRRLFSLPREKMHWKWDCTYLPMLENIIANHYHSTTTWFAATWNTDCYMIMFAISKNQVLFRKLTLIVLDHMMILESSCRIF